MSSAPTLCLNTLARIEGGLAALLADFVRRREAANTMLQLDMQHTAEALALYEALEHACHLLRLIAYAAGGGEIGPDRQLTTATLHTPSSEESSEAVEDMTGRKLHNLVVNLVRPERLPLPLCAAAGKRRYKCFAFVTSKPLPQPKRWCRCWKTMPPPAPI
jgi:hypothetical protein